MPKISHTAQIIQDLFFQDYASDESFLKIEHIKYLIGSFYNSLLNADYEKSKMENKVETGYIYPTISSELIRRKEYTVKTDGDFKYIEIDPVVNFPYDNYGYGVADVGCIKNQVCGQFKRTTVSVKNVKLPFTNIVWWWVQGVNVYFHSTSKIPSSVSVYMIPAINVDDDNFEIPQSFEQTLITQILGLLKGAASGVVIDMSNNSNPNTALATEIDTVLRNFKQNKS